MFDFPAERTPDRTGVIRTWVPRIVLSLFFLSTGSQKFSEHQWVETFETIGFGDWFRTLTGSLQIAGALLLLIPKTAIAGVAVLSATMVGAMLAWIFFLGSPGAAVFPAIILAILLSVGMSARTGP